MAGDKTELDVQGLMCPLPVLKARKVLKGMAPGDILHMVATDPASVIDVPHFCNEAGHKLLAGKQDGDLFIFEIERH